MKLKGQFATENIVEARVKHWLVIPIGSQPDISVEALTDCALEEREVE